MEHPQRKVDNNVVALFGGSSRCRVIVLFDRARFLALADGEGDLLEEISKNVMDIVFGVCQLKSVEGACEGRLLYVRDSSYESIMRRMALASAQTDGAKLFSWCGEPVTPRTWSYYWGIRRRGLAARNRLQRALDLGNEPMNKLVEVLWRMPALASESSEMKA